MIPIVIIHWIADFILQTRWQGNNKSKNNKALLAHTVTYSLCYLVLMPWYGFWNTVTFIAITFVCHTITDYFTSRGTGYCWGKVVKTKEDIAGREHIYDTLKDDPKWEFRDLYHKEMAELKAQGSSYEAWFWGIIGFDQGLHMIQLILTYELLSPSAGSLFIKFLFNFLN